MDLRSVIRLTWASDLTGTIARLSGAVDFTRSIAGGSARVGPREARLRRDRPRSCNYCRAPLIHVVELLTVARSFALVLKLSRHGRDSRAPHSRDFSRSWPNVDAASAAVVGHAGVVIDNDRAVVDVGDASDIDTVNRAVVVEVISIPIAAVIAHAGVAEAVVDAAVEADMKSPETAVEAVAVAIEAPVAGGPKRAIVRRGAPGTRNPVVATRTPAPIARCPQIVGFGSLRLLVDRQWRRRLVSVFDGLSLTVRVKLVIGLGVLVGLILIRRWRSRLLRCWLLRSVLLRYLLGLRLRSNSEDLPLSGSRSRRGGWLRLTIVDGCHIGVGWIGPSVVGDGCGVGILPVATRGSDER